MISMFIVGITGGLVAAYFAWPYGWLAAAGAYVAGGTLCALVPAIIGWRLEVARERSLVDAPVSERVAREDARHG
jgi:hypothetical protein